MSSGEFIYRKKAVASSAVAPHPVPSPPAACVEGEIKTATVVELQEISSSDCLLELESKMTAWRAVPLVAWCLLPLYLFSMAGFSSVQSHLQVFGGAAVLCFACATHFDRTRTPYLFYDLDSLELLKKYVGASRIGAALQSAQRLWHITASVPTADYKYNAGAKELIKRTAIGCRPGTLGRLRMNIEPWVIPAGPQQLLFLPDQMLVLEGSRLVGVPYGELRASATVTHFIEEERPPSDACRVGSSWRYPNKDGSRDLRFNNNFEIPVMEYAEVHLRSKSGVNIIVQVSSPAAAADAVDAVNAMSGRTPPASEPELMAAGQAEPLPPKESISTRLPGPQIPFGSADQFNTILCVQDIIGNTLTVSRDDSRPDIVTLLVKAKNKRSVPTGPSLSRYDTTRLKALLKEAWGNRSHRSVGDFHRYESQLGTNGASVAVYVRQSSIVLMTTGVKHAPRCFIVDEKRVLEQLMAALSFDNNFEIPVMEYADVHLRSKSGVNIIAQVSSPAAAADAAVNAMSGRTSPAPETELIAAGQAEPSPPKESISTRLPDPQIPFGSADQFNTILCVQDIIGNTLTVSRDDSGPNVVTLLVKAKNKRSVPTGPSLSRHDATRLKALLEEAWGNRGHRSVGDFYRYESQLGTNGASVTVSVYQSSIFLTTTGVKHAPRCFIVDEKRVLEQLMAALSFADAADAVNAMSGRTPPASETELIAAGQAEPSPPKKSISTRLPDPQIPFGSADQFNIILCVQDSIGSTLTVSRDDSGPDVVTLLVKAKNKRSVPTGPSLSRHDATRLKALLKEAWGNRIHRSVGDFHRYESQLGTNGASVAVYVRQSSIVLMTTGVKHAPRFFTVGEKRVLEQIMAALSFD